MISAIPALLLLIVPAANPGQQVDFNRDVRPILAEHCFACHGPDVSTRKADLRLDTKEGLLAETSGGHAVIPGKADDSEIIQRIISDSRTEVMPPPKAGKKLSTAQIEILKKWILQGATWSGHWAFQPLQRQQVPGQQHPIDHFIQTRLKQNQLTQAPLTDKATLLRRVYIDLIGVPPNRQELSEFLNDPRPNAYEFVVDKLLASPHYGERWGRHWMDVWRYSDWYGRRSVPDVLNSYAQIWRWRDWIVQNVNQDRGYNEMVEMMLAADEIAPNRREDLVATGFVVRNFYRWNYNNWMRDNIEHTAKAFLGLTLNCCHCHDHKYDPITQEEYFQFRAIFEPLEIRHDRWPGEPDPGPYPKYKYGSAYKPITSGMVRVIDEKLDAPTHFYMGGDERNIVKDRPPVPPGVPAALGGKFQVEKVSLPTSSWFPGSDEVVRMEERDARALEVRRTARDLISSWLLANRPSILLNEAAFAAATADLRSIQARIAADDITILDRPGDKKAAIEKAGKSERELAVERARLALTRASVAQLAARASKKPEAEKTTLKQLTDAQKQLEQANQLLGKPITTYTALSVQYPKNSSGRRTALAKWITRPDNPLTPRVAVNHIWAHHFGRPLVETTNNFGASGKAPTHPELLDWLASEFMKQGWKSKPIHRLIVTSRAYRSESGLSPGVQQSVSIDPDTLLLWRFPIQRMEAEVVRDSLLAVAGELDRSAGGPEIPQDQGMTSHRRSLYFAHHGEARMTFLELFDAANPCDAYRRTSSVLPQQALALTNSDLAVSLSRKLATKLSQEANSESEFVELAFRQVLSRSARQQESQLSVSFLQRQQELLQDSLKEKAKQRARENLVLTLFNHTDFVTVR